MLAPYGERWPDNVWLGATAENKKWLDKRICELGKQMSGELSYPNYGHVHSKPEQPYRRRAGARHRHADRGPPAEAD